MKKKWGIIVALLCSLLLAVNVRADDGVSQDPEYVTDYYMIVQSPDGGVDIYSEADPQSSRLNEKQIVNGTAIHIQGEKTGTDNKKWGYTQYHGMNGYVPMDNLDPVDRAKAIESEFKTFGGEDVDLQVKVQTEDGNADLYNGPGEKYGEVAGSDGIADGTAVHISQQIHGEDGVNWGKADTDPEGWLNLDRDTDYQSEVVDMQSDSAQTAAEKETTVTPTPKATPTEETTPTPEATPTEEVTPTPEATPTEEVTPTPEATPTEEVTPTPEATPTEEATPTPEATPTQEVTPTEEITPTKEATPTKESTKDSQDDTKKASGENVKAAGGFHSPVIWISIIGIIVIVILMIYFLKKKK